MCNLSFKCLFLIDLYHLVLGPGTVGSVRFPTDKDSQKSKGYAYVDIHKLSDAKRVRNKNH